jgi:hypothetical protein
VRAITEEYGQVIVLEDDLIVGPLALSYFRAGLLKYENASRVMAVCGYTPTMPTKSRGAYFLPFASSWGWATWSRAWSDFSIEPESYAHLLRSHAFRRLFAAPGIAALNTMLRAQSDGLVDSWAILWNAHIAYRGGLCLFPASTMVINRGLASFGATHSSRLNPINTALSRIESNAKFATEFELPDPVLPDMHMVDVVAGSPVARLNRIATRLGYVRRKAFRRF